jgi:hypothetical protein
MSTLAEIEAAIEKLPASQLQQLVTWLNKRWLDPELSTLVTEPDFLARARKIWGENPGGTPLSELVSEARN